MNEQHQYETTSTILIVDDTPDNLRLLTGILEEDGYIVRKLRDGNMVMSSVLSAPPDLILLDILMPETDGYEVCGQLKAKEQTRDIPVIFISALDEAVNKVKAFSTGGVDYITKPFQKQEVLARVQTHLHLRRAQQTLQEQNVQLQRINSKLTREITQRKQLKAELQRQRDFLKNAIESLNHPFYLVDAHTYEVLMANKATAPDGLTGNITCHALTHNQTEPCNSVEHSCPLKLVKKTKKAVTVEHTHYDWDGNLLNVEVHAHPVFDDAGNVVQVIEYCIDITKRKKVEKTLQDSEERFRRLFEDSPVSLWEEDFSDLRTYIDSLKISEVKDLRTYFENHPESLARCAEMIRIVDVNKATMDLYRAKDKEALLNNLAVVFTPESYPMLREGIIALAGGQDFESEAVTRTLDGKKINVIVKWIVVPGYEKTMSRVLISVTDITAIKRVHAKLEQSREAAEAANHAKSAFLTNMSHELRTPLNAILGFSQLLGHATNLEPEQQENLGTIRRSGEHLLTLINQVLDLSKIEAGRITLDESDFDLHRLLDETEYMFRLHAKNKGLELLFERTSDVPRHIRTDKVKLRQTLINLLNNAMKFTKKGGVCVRIENCEKVVAKRLTSSFTLLFSISDTGPGIEPDELDKLFEAFVQTKTGRESHKGTGLGLTISRKFVQLMGGEIKVESEVGRGTTFIFQIMAGVSEAARIETGKPARKVITLEPNQPRYRILIVDDKEDNRRLIVKLLNPFGFEVREAENGRQAIEIWKAWRPHFIWMDIQMPVMDGYAAIKVIRKLETRNLILNTEKSVSVIIIAVSASAFEEERVTAMASGCDDFLRKPFYETDVTDLMTKHLGVRFVYEESAETCLTKGVDTDKKALTSVKLNTLPKEFLAALKRSAERTDPKRSNLVIDRIRKHDEPLADALADLVAKYRFDIIQELFKEM